MFEASIDVKSQAYLILVEKCVNGIPETQLILFWPYLYIPVYLLVH